LQNTPVIAGDKIVVKYEEGWFRGTVVAVSMFPVGSEQENAGKVSLRVLYDGPDGEQEDITYPDADVYVEGMDEIPEGAKLPDPMAQPEAVEAKDETPRNLSEYEQQREDNIKRNQDFMKTLNMGGTKEQMQAMGMNHAVPEDRKRKKGDDDSSEWEDDEESGQRRKKKQHLRSDGAAQIPVLPQQQQQLQQQLQPQQIQQPLQQPLNPIQHSADRANRPSFDSAMKATPPNVLPPGVAERLRAQEVSADAKSVHNFCCIAGITMDELEQLLVHHTWLDIRKGYNPGGGVIRRGKTLLNTLAQQAAAAPQQQAQQQIHLPPHLFPAAGAAAGLSLEQMRANLEILNQQMQQIPNLLIEVQQADGTSVNMTPAQLIDIQRKTLEQQAMQHQMAQQQGMQQQVQQVPLEGLAQQEVQQPVQQMPLDALAQQGLQQPVQQQMVQQEVPMQPMQQVQDPNAMAQQLAPQ
jgi:hypothetical protein